MRKKLVLSVLALLSIVGLAGALSGMAAPAGMGLDWTGLLDSGTSTPAPVPLGVASKVQAFYQGDASIGWDSQQQYQTWWPSACSPAALTMVLNAWGAQVRIGQVLDRLIARQAITPENGLLNANALAQVANDFGYQARTFWNWNEQQVADVTAQGAPVMIDVVDTQQQTPYPGFVVGHWLTVVGVSPDHIDVRDSSGYHIKTLTPEVFHILYTGIGVVVWQGTSLKLPDA
ncbi:MAG TPA: C39 family peptidase [Ktedonobacterales bacterium]|nr:C39 family peptidase [Ktedonobacterales bacterium]